MRKRRRGYRKYKFTEKTLSKRGITALVLALLSLVSFVVMVVLAFRSAGNLSIYIACYGILAFFAALAAVILAIISLKEEIHFAAFRMLLHFCQFFHCLSGLLSMQAVFCCRKN